jgi:hypothetical protein
LYDSFDIGTYGVLAYFTKNTIFFYMRPTSYKVVDSTHKIAVNACS